jgi:hypothetical protein
VDIKCHVSALQIARVATAQVTIVVLQLLRLAT